MKSKVYGIRISSVLVAVAIVMIAVAVLIKDCETISSLLNNLGMGVFGSSIVVLLVSIGEYSVEKRTTLLDYYSLCIEAKRAFKKINYYCYDEEAEAMIDYMFKKWESDFYHPLFEKDFLECQEKIRRFYKINQPDSVPEINEEYLNRVWKRVKETLDKRIEEYVDFDFSIQKLDHYYNALFFFSKRENKKYKNWIDINLQSYITEMYRNVKYCSDHISNLDIHDTAYYPVIAELITGTQTSLYSVDNDLKNTETIYSVFADELDSRIEVLKSKIYNYDANITTHLPYSVKKSFKGGDIDA